MSEILQSVLTTYKKRPTVAILMSGGGSNAKTLLGNEAVRDLYDVRAIFSDNPNSRAYGLAAENRMKCIIDPVARFGNKEERVAYFGQALMTLENIGIQAVFYAGFMKIASPQFCHELPGVNVHPADLTIQGEDGIAKYRGMQALPDMRRGEGYVASSMHVVDTPVDTGSVLAVTERVSGPPEASDSQWHDILKSHEHALYPLGLTMLGTGSINSNNAPFRMAI